MLVKFLVTQLLVSSSSDESDTQDDQEMWLAIVNGLCHKEFPPEYNKNQNQKKPKLKKRKLRPTITKDFIDRVILNYTDDEVSPYSLVLNCKFDILFFIKFKAKFRVSRQVCDDLTKKLIASKFSRSRSLKQPKIPLQNYMYLFIW